MKLLLRIVGPLGTVSAAATVPTAIGGAACCFITTIVLPGLHNYSKQLLPLLLPHGLRPWELRTSFPKMIGHFPSIDMEARLFDHSRSAERDTERERDIERERERGGGREKGRGRGETDRQRERQRDRETERQTDRERRRDRERECTGCYIHRKNSEINTTTNSQPTT